MKGDTVNVYSVDFYRKNLKGFLKSHSTYSDPSTLIESFYITNNKGVSKTSYTGTDYLDMRIQTCRLVLIEKMGKLYL